MSIALKYVFMKFMLRHRAYKVLKYKAHEVEHDCIWIWKEAFGFITPSVEVREVQDAIEFEDEYKKEVSMMTTEIQQLASGYKQKDSIIIEDDTDIPPTNPNVLIKEEIQGLMKDSRKLYRNPFFV